MDSRRAAGKRARNLVYVRRASQAACLALFAFLFIKTDYPGSDELTYAVNILFRLDPLLALSVWPASGTVITLMLPALLTVALTVLLGRFFCGWVCPMGSLLDLSRALMPPRSGRQAGEKAPARRAVKYYLLIFLVVAAFFGLPAVGYFDPFSILVRGLALSCYPAFNALNTEFFTFTYQHAPGWVNAVTEPVYQLLGATVLPFRQEYYDLAVLSLVILSAVFLLELLERRFFCRNICPLGALLACCARFSPLRGQGGGKCGSCRNCRDICRMDAIDEEKKISPLDCNLCMDCVAECPGAKISFSRIWPLPAAAPVPNLSRRGVLTTLVAAAGLPFFLRGRSLARRPDPGLIRPPGALIEKDFLVRCVRCGECMKVCIGNGLQPTLLEAGLEGMFTPRLNARIGYCEYNCTLCGQVCPTGAIQSLSPPLKRNTKIGNAFFDKNRCLPHAKAIACIVCEEHCPTPDKAIKFREVAVVNNRGVETLVKQPYLVDELCIGCGICVTKCPLPGDAAIVVTSAGESRDPGKALPLSSGFFY